MHQTIVLDRRGSTPDDQVSPHFPSGSFVPKSTSRETDANTDRSSVQCGQNDSASKTRREV